MDKISSYGILSRIYVLAQNINLGLVSRNFHEISTLDSVRASFLIKKFGKNNILKFKSYGFVHFNNLSKRQELVLKLLEKGSGLNSKSKQNLFKFSIERGWNKIVEYFLNNFLETTEEKFREIVVQERMNENYTELSISPNNNFKYYIPTIYINQNNGEWLRLAVYYRQMNITKQLLNAHKIKPKIESDKLKAKILPHPKATIIDLSLKGSCDILEEGGLDLMKIFLLNGLERCFIDSIFREFCYRGNVKFTKFLVENEGYVFPNNSEYGLMSTRTVDRTDIVKHLLEKSNLVDKKRQNVRKIDKN
ncbi:hypothetical protein BB558_002599 [Smittium angustum]|uniref:Uncharacterized protein n=1 Tax=Smittium angustum TaxID=133377 RepID=A0A2U1J876_SMIAN|nr:hypothetical protein BB558_002599 [Smittium angustum]